MKYRQLRLRTVWFTVALIMILASLGLLSVFTDRNATLAKKVSPQPVASHPRQSPLTLLSLSQDSSSRYEMRMLSEFGQRHRVPVHYMPSGGDSVTRQLDLYQQILRRQYSQPDILMIDTAWPALLADDLLDLKPYLTDAIAASAPIEIQNNTVNGRVVAIPMVIDFGVLYYRPALLERYGFHHAPDTWEELEYMARVIQRGERLSGNRDFWGYGWAGGNTEALTCSALEWFLSSSGSNFVEQDGTVRLDNPQNVAALKRAVSWIGTISPPGVPLYHESDVENLWRAGQAAFVRGWVNTSAVSDKPAGGDRRPFEVAPIPAGPMGHYGVLGDMSLSISKYAANRDLAITALREFTSETVQRDRLHKWGIIPTRLALFQEPDTLRHTLLRNATAQRALKSLAIRPSTLLGTRYEEVTRDISASINAVLLGRQSAEAALAALQSRIAKTARSGSMHISTQPEVK